MRTRSGTPGGEFDLLVIGTGAAGMAAAIRGAELGRRVGIIEGNVVGGTCVNVGCIPSKYLLATAERVHALGSGFPGAPGHDASLDWARVQSSGRKLRMNLQRAKYLDVLDAYETVTLLTGHARLGRADELDVDGTVHRAPKVVIATGTSPWLPRIPGLEADAVLDSASVMDLDEVPESMIVLGGGSVGVEFGQAFARLGTRVTLLEVRSRILPMEDEDASRTLRLALEADGLEIVTQTQIKRAESGSDGTIRLLADTLSGVRWFEAGRVLAATGRRARTTRLGLEDVGVALDPLGFIQVDEQMRTSNPDIFAAGDVAGGPGFVYVAAAGGRVAADNAIGAGGQTLDLRAIPRVAFTDPQVAAVGLDPAQARERRLDVKLHRLGMEHVPRARVELRTEGWIQIVALRGSGRIVGVQAVGRHAAELMGEATMVVRHGLTVDDVTQTLHPYLTWVEGLKLAAQGFTTDVTRLSCCA